MIPLLISVTSKPWTSPVLAPGRYVLEADVPVRVDGEFVFDDALPPIARLVNVKSGTPVAAGHPFLIVTPGDARVIVHADGEDGEAVLTRLDQGAA